MTPKYSESAYAMLSSSHSPGSSSVEKAEASSPSSTPSEDVPVTEQMLLKAIAWDTKFKNKSVDEVDEVMGKVTHLKLHGVSPPLTRVDDLSRFKSLQNLYLYDNKLNHLSSLPQCQSLTHLYLQNNCLESTEMIQSLPKLKKLYVDCNRIARISGLYGCTSLEELHVSDQLLEEKGASVEFNKGSLTSIGPSLKIFVAQGNNIKDVDKLCILTELEEVDLSRNRINDSTSLKKMFQECTQLKKLSLLNNPVCKTSRSIEADAILTCQVLEEFNNKEISDQKRKCIQIMHTRRKK